MAFAGVITSQERGWQISSRIVTEGGKPLPYATVALLRASDSSLVDGTLSDNEGKFSLIVNEEGKYILRISFVGFATFTDTIVVARGVAARLPETITMRESAITKGEVVVTGERAWGEIKVDRKVYEPAANPSLKGATVEKAFEQIPGIEIDENGNILLRGEPAQIYINGKPSLLFQAGGGNMLKTIPTDRVERIEVITTPGARYEAQGNAGIINIVLKSRESLADVLFFTGAVAYPPENTLSAGYTGKLPQKKGTWTLTLAGFYEKNPRMVRHSRWTYHQSDTSFLRSEREEWETHYGIRPAVNASIALSRKVEFNGTVSAHISRHISEDTVHYALTYPWNTWDAVRSSTERENHNSLEGMLSLDFKHARKGTTSISMRYEIDRETRQEKYIEEALTNLWQETPPQELNNDHTSQALEMEFTDERYIDTISKLEWGGKLALRDMSYTSKAFQEEKGTWIAISDPLFSGKAVYKETVGGLFLIYTVEMGRWGLQAGLRGELSDISVREQIAGTFNMHTIDPFPSFAIMWHPSKNVGMNMLYSKRIKRPSLHDLIPDFSLDDRYTQFTGNPSLKPEYTHSFEINIQWTRSRLLTINLTPFYRYTTSPIQRVRTLDTARGLTIIQPMNLKEMRSAGGEFFLRISPVSWSATTISGHLVWSHLDATNIPTTPFVRKYIHSRFSVSQEFTLPGQLTLQFFAWCVIPGGFGNIRITRFVINPTISARKMLLRGALQITVSAENPFRTAYFTSVTEEEIFRQETYFSRWIPRYRVAVTYNPRLKRKIRGKEVERGEMEMF